MKYLDYPVLTQLSHVLSDNPTPESRTNARVEAYSIKPVARDRKMFREMEEQYVSGQEDMDEMSFSPEMKEAGLTSCFGRLDVKESRKVHFLLVSTLNSAFPGYDFSALRPDHFTREINAAQVLSHLSTNLLAIDALDLSPLATSTPNASGSSPSYSPSLGSSPNAADVGNPSLYRILNEVLPLGECEVYSWFPEPEYDPHVDPEDNESASEYDEEDSEEMFEDDSMDLDADVGSESPYVSWGQAGIELEMDEDPPAPSVAKTSRSGSLSGIDFGDLPMFSPTLAPIAALSPARKVGSILWSANYFFYSKRQKRVLFITTWCRKRPSHEAVPTDQVEEGSLPLPISSSFTPPSSSFQGFTQMAKTRSPRITHHNLSNARPSHRRSKLASKLATGRTLATSTIPIRASATPVAPATPSRMAASAPAATFSPLTSPSTSAGARGTPGFRPRQTTARMLINAAAANRPKGEATAAATGSSAAGESSRVRKERSGSLTPGPVLGLVDAVVGSSVVSDAAKGKRVKV